MQHANDVLREAHDCHIKGDLGRAEYLYCKLVAHDETHPLAYFGLGTIYAQVHAHGRAITFLKKAIELMPDGNGAMENLAAVYRELENRDKARYWGERALAIARTPIALSNMAGTYINDANPELALKWANEAIAMKPTPEALNHKALALLEMGRFEEAWKIYDARLDLPQFHRRPYTVPMWTGKPVKLLAIHGEQGLGDEVMFLTCLKQLRERYDIGRVVIECNPRLVSLLENSLGAKCYGSHEELVKAEKPDAYIPMGSLPGFVWPVVPNAYLKPSKPLPKTGRIGLSWKGGTVQTHSVLRNAPIDVWRTFLTLGTCVSLQYGPEKEEASQLWIEHDEEAIADLDRLAALIQSCSLVISVCNTTIHMAGALGVPCVIVVPSRPAWRYGLTGEKMVWYESPLMVRQAEGEAWTSVMERAKSKALEILSADNRQLPRIERTVA